jgi:hypothetical protein
MSTNARAYLPDGQLCAFPPSLRTWTDQASGVKGDSLRAPLVEHDAGGATAWHRQRATYLGFASLAQSIPASTWTAITGHTELVDNWAGHSDTTNTGRYYAPFTNSDGGSGAGDWYLCIGNVPMNGNSTTNAHIAGLRVNGSSSAIYEGAKLPGNTGHGITPAIVDLIQMSGQNGDYIELAGWTDESSVSTVVSSKAPNLQVRWVCQSNNSAFAAFTPSVPGAPHTWTATDIITGSATGTNKVPLNTELRDTVRFLNNPPIFRVHTSGTSQTIPTGAGTWTAITFQGESIDPYGMWSSGSSVTCQRAGLYFVAGHGAVTETSTKTGYRAVRIHHTIAAGGSADYYGSSIQAGTGTNTTGTTMLASAHIRMAAGDTLQLQYDHTNGSALSVLGTSVRSCARMIGVWESK